MNTQRLGGRDVLRHAIATGALAALLLFWLPAFAEPIRASFLRDRTALLDTVAFLKDSGCTQGATSRFQKAVERYYATSFTFDFTQFPESKQGFYDFESASDLVKALPHPLADTEHAYDFNCFDAVITLTADRLRTGLRPDDLFGPILAPHTTTNGTFMILPAATSRDAFSLVYPEWYREPTEHAFAQPDVRVSLTAALFRCHVLPLSTTEAKLGKGLLEVLRASWRRQEMAFPQGFEVVLCHQVNFPQHMFVAAHAGLLFPRKGGYTYIEKAGGKGPFVRLDFNNKADLRTWLSAIFKGAGKFGYTHHLVTFNDTKVEMLDFAK